MTLPRRHLGPADHRLTLPRRLLGTALAQLRDVLGRLLAADAASGTAGCFSVNSIAELLPHDEEVAKLARRNLRYAEEAFTAQLERASRDGELAPATTPREGARRLLSLVQGLQIMRKVDLDPARAAACLDSTFVLLGRPPGRRRDTRRRPGRGLGGALRRTDAPTAMKHREARAPAGPLRR
ncbi:TetR family transcriptional regulator C-terminal domain-containing protein [Streptomyces sp. MJM1172]|uniref:TetR family transcriptional regulator C-terminal domain-containing protein n=1 Tax=Streptomyces sp. MJM1172 TaxID=1703926 RepID=UPI00116151AF|nr:hypothetical protein [Streptomyces sp. MJM1172]